MKKKFIIIPVVLIFLGIFLYSSFKSVKPQQVDNAPNWVKIEDAFVQAAASDKLILVDVYEVGCKYCRAMERDVYPDTTVRVVLDEGYIPVKVNGNSEELITINGVKVTEQAFAQSNGAFVFPTVLILNSKGELLRKRTGYMGVDDLRRFLYRSES
tara:strand:+ start:16463 stop:16930 length:468 start_codon:yes stop_codon:yes gene_type:complete